MSNIHHEIWTESRYDWLHEHDCTEADVLSDEDGNEYILSTQDEEDRIDSICVRLPANLQSDYVPA